MAEFPRARVHVEIKTSNHLPAVDDFPGFNRRIPRRHVHFLLERDMKELRGRVHDAFFHARIRQVGPHRLRIEVVFRSPKLLANKAGFVLPDFLCVGIGLLFFSQKHGKFALGHGTGGGVQIANEIGDVLPVDRHFVSGIVVGP